MSHRRKMTDAERFELTRLEMETISGRVMQVHILVGRIVATFALLVKRDWLRIKGLWGK